MVCRKLLSGSAASAFLLGSAYGYQEGYLLYMIALILFSELDLVFLVHRPIAFHFQITPFIDMHCHILDLMENCNQKKIVFIRR